MRKQADLGAGDAARASARADEGENSSVTGLTHGDAAQSNEGPDRAGRWPHPSVNPRARRLDQCRGSGNLSRAYSHDFWNKG